MPQLGFAIPLPTLGRRKLRLESFEEGRKHQVNSVLKKQLLKFFPALDQAIFDGMTFEKRSTSFQDASCDIFVYDQTGRLKFQGRAFRSSATQFWAL
jgi:hypothetical protein